VEIAAGLIMAVLDAILAITFIWTYTRCQRLCFLLLCAGALIFTLINVYAAAICYSALTHTTLLPTPSMHLVTSVYIIMNPVAAIVSFIGTILLLRFTLKLYATQKT
jgi:hypothetical protein